MAQATMTVRTDAAVKEEFTNLCEQFGMSVNTAMNVYMRAVMEARCIPFQISVNKTKAKKDSLQTLYQKLNDLQNLSADWDVYGTPAPSAQCINGAKYLISILPNPILDKISIEPSEWGGISIRIDNNDKKLSIRILDSGITWYVKTSNGTEFHEEEPCSEKVYRDIVNSISLQNE